MNLLIHRPISFDRRVEMARKKIVDPEIERVAENEGTIFFKVKHALTEREFTLLSERVRSEAEKSGQKIILVPFSCELEVEVSGT
jgi:hypothetical protein